MMLASNPLNSSFNRAFFGNLKLASLDTDFSPIRTVEDVGSREVLTTSFLFITHSLTWTRPQSGARFAWLVSFKISDSSIDRVTVALH